MKMYSAFMETLMNKKFLSKIVLGALLAQSLCLENTSGNMEVEDDVVFPPEIERVIQKYEKKNKETFFKNLIWYIPFTNPYGPSREAREKLGVYYQQAIPRIYKDPVYSYTKRSEQLANLAESIDDAEMKKLSDNLSFYYRVKSGEGWMDRNNTTRTILGKRYGGSDPNFLNGKPYTEMVDEWRAIISDGSFLGLKDFEKAERLTAYSQRFGNIDALISIIRNNLKNVDELPEDVKIALANGSSSNLLASTKNSRKDFSISSVSNAFTNLGNKLLSDSTVGRDFVWMGGATVATLSSGVLKTISEKIKDGVRQATILGKRVLSKSLNTENYEEMLKKLEEELKAEVIGQDEAIEKIISILRNHFSNVVKAKAIGKTYNKGCLIILGGPPGLGKSLIMEKIKKFFNLTCVMLTMNEAIEDKGNNASSVMARFLKPVIKDDGKKKIEEETELARVIRYGNTTLYFLDEKDKMDMLDFSLQKIDPLNAEGKRKGSSIDEYLRSFVDYDKLNNYTTNNSIHMVTTNELKEHMLKYEGSLANRYLPCFVEFKPFNIDACIKMAKVLLKSPCGEFYKGKGISVSWDKSGLQRYAQRLSKDSVNGRTMSLLSKHWTVVVDNFLRLESNRGCSNVLLSYDEKSNKVFAKKGKENSKNALAAKTNTGDKVEGIGKISVKTESSGSKTEAIVDKNNKDKTKSDENVKEGKDKATDRKAEESSRGIKDTTNVSKDNKVKNEPIEESDKTKEDQGENSSSDGGKTKAIVDKNNKDKTKSDEIVKEGKDKATDKKIEDSSRNIKDTTNVSKDNKVKNEPIKESKKVRKDKGGSKDTADSGNTKNIAKKKRKNRDVTKKRNKNGTGVLENSKGVRNSNNNEKDIKNNDKLLT